MFLSFLVKSFFWASLSVLVLITVCLISFHRYMMLFFVFLLYTNGRKHWSTTWKLKSPQLQVLSPACLGQLGFWVKLNFTTSTKHWRKLCLVRGKQSWPDFWMTEISNWEYGFMCFDHVYCCTALNYGVGRLIKLNSKSLLSINHTVAYRDEWSYSNLWNIQRKWSNYQYSLFH